VIFTESPVPCNRGFVYHRDGSGLFRLAGTCPCKGTNYEVGFHANIQIPTGGTVETISLAVFVDGEEDPSSIMSVTPAAVEEPFNVGAGIIATVPCICKCSSVSIRNVSTQAIEVSAANITFDR
ncbi:MAG: hypothetical protein K6B72_02115, partial [Lachnospiraceae bacterium]|nr:hypothetical protein [Lachnospiraceae bacterium]